MRFAPLTGMLAAALLVACAKQPEKPAQAAAAAAKPVFGSFGVDLAAMDKSVRPGDDFYEYVNGKWLETAQIPPDKSYYGTVTTVFEKTEANLHAIVDELAAGKPEPGSVDQKVADLYGSWMDQAGIEARGLDPIKPYLERIAAAKDKADLMKLIGTVDYQAPFNLYVDADTADPTRYVVWVGQSGLGMPNRDYYINKGPKFDAYRAAYRTYVTKVFELLGDKDPADSAGRVIALENRIAQVAWPEERRRNVAAINNPMDRAGLKQYVPAVDWDVVLAGVDLGDAQNFIVNENTAIRDGAKLLDTQPLADWKTYMTFHFVDSYASDLTQALDAAQFEFHGKALRGVEQQRDRWKRGLTLVDDAIGEGLGQIYVRKHFVPETKAKMDDLVNNLRAAMKERLTKLAWMDDATRAEALKKLDAFEARIGYPDKWRDYSALVVERGKHFENARNARLFEWQRRARRLKEPVDRSEWDMTPQTMDAYYNPLKNQITFPAGILQPPMFDPNADPAVNYGAIGSVIGHEIGHGFDDQGREFDGSGKVRNWWTKETNAKFEAATKNLAALYHTFCPLDGACVNGELTMGENIGDLGGLEMAYTAYQLSLKGQPAPVLDGYTGDQRFFMSFAQVWRGKMRDDALRRLMLTNPHSPTQARGTYPERNMDAWYAAFDVQPTDKSYLKPEERVHIW
ncbi:MAG TPA: M13 family metallopeptidase [Steroidobacteraceae bacterium]|nr:M13 family metallopeptidase [Steroidobacteraceae bacterium]